MKPFATLALIAALVPTTLAPIAAFAQTQTDKPAETLEAPQATAPLGTPMDAAAFDAYTQGRTLSYASQGQAYGIEQYLPGQRVRWAFIGDTCQEGLWFQRDELICFVYEYNPSEEQCWIFSRTDSGMRGVFMGPDGPGTELYEVQQSSQPLTCSNLDVGV